MQGRQDQWGFDDDDLSESRILRELLQEYDNVSAAAKKSKPTAGTSTAAASLEGVEGEMARSFIREFDAQVRGTTTPAAVNIPIIGGGGVVNRDAILGSITQQAGGTLTGRDKDKVVYSSSASATAGPGKHQPARQTTQKFDEDNWKEQDADTHPRDGGAHKLISPRGKGSNKVQIKKLAEYIEDQLDNAFKRFVKPAEAFDLIKQRLEQCQAKSQSAY